MLNMGYLHQIHSFQLPPEAEWHSLISHFYARYNHMHDVILTEFGPNGFVVLFFFFLFLLIIIIIYIISIIDTFRAGQAELEDENAEPNGLFYTVENPELTLANDNDQHLQQIFDSEEMEKLQKECELSADIIQASRQTSDYLNLEHDYLELKKKMQRHAKESQRRRKMLEQQQKMRDEQNADIAEQQPEEKLPDNPIVAILCMFGHGVTEQKIAQAVYYYHKEQMSEEDTMQIVATLREFVELCNAGKFNFEQQKPPLPELNEALIDLSAGDSAPCLILLQSLLNTQMKKAEQEAGLIRDFTYAVAANIACIMGNIVHFNDLELAHNSYELATELSPKNVTAWSRLGDVFMKEKSREKAMIAYQNVLDIADRIMYSQQIANAKQKLAEYYFDQGLEAKAEKMRDESTRYYELYGIGTPLSPIEMEVYRTLTRESADTLDTVVNTLLSHHS